MTTDSSFPGGPTGFGEFLADYFVECDEHLSIARSSLLRLEASLETASVDRSLLDELFRSFHSLKGLSAMVGFHDAEQLAHHLETFLGNVRRNQTALDLAGFEALIEGVAAIEKIIAARRDATAPPDTSQLLHRLARLLPIDSPGSGKSPPTSPTPSAPDATKHKETLIAEKLARGGVAWQITFSPSAALVARGIDVNSVRQRLQALGEIVHAVPEIVAGGGIMFVFVMISGAAEDVVAALAIDGVSCAPYQSAANPEPPLLPSRAPKTAEEGPSTHLTPANVVRVDLQRLDELMRLVGELVLTRARLDDGLSRFDGVAPPSEVRVLRETALTIERQLRDLREGVMRVRMVPVREVFARMQFVVRDLIRELGKRVALRFSGEDTQIDKYVVERIMDPLLHLVRNAVSHGLEPPEERTATGKFAEGQLHLRAHTTGETVVVEVEDDGRGIDVEAVRAHARTLGMPDLAVDSASVLDVLCIPGFSTREHSDRVSGRGIGMDVVRNSIEELGGSLSLHTSRGQGTRFEIQLPLTLAITDALIVKAGDERFAVPQVAVREIIRIESGDSTIIEQNELLRYRQGVLPLLRLSRVFGGKRNTSDEHYALVIGEGAQGVAIVVDRVLGLREIVVRPLTDRLVQVPGIAGATELGDGRVVLILDTASLSRSIRQRGSAKASTGTGVYAQPREQKHV